jgi:hypothetical protein
MKNNNYPTWLVPLDIAQELKEIGFNEACPFIVYPNDDEVVVSGTVTVEEDWLDEDNYGEVIIDLPISQCNTFNKLNFQTIPTWEQVFELFREKGFDSYIGLESHPYPDEGIYYYFEISKPNLYRINQLAFQGDFDDYNEAREALVKALIRTYKKEQL